MKTIIIAEAGVNHNGEIKLAKELIDIAAESKADYVKFQTFKSEKIVSQSAKKAEYQVKNFNENNDSQLSMLKSLELSERDHYALFDYCKKKNIKFLSTGFDLLSLDFLNSLNIDFFKIPSGEITNYQYLRKVASFNKPIILSTGMSTLDEISEAVELLNSNCTNNITVLHCNTSYPTKMEDVNLKAMIDIQKKFNVDVGYSDHTLGIEVPIAAVALGATVIEKHFTISRNLSGPDHKASLEPDELKKMIDAIRNIEEACKGDGFKTPTKSELKNKIHVRKSIHLSKNVKKGDQLSENNIIALRPGDGINPMKISNLLGKKFNKDLEMFSKIKMKDIDHD